jgi:hypothetical protein
MAGRIDVELLAQALRPGAFVTGDRLRALGLDEREVERLLYGLPEFVVSGVRRVYFPAEQVRARVEQTGWR